MADPLANGTLLRDGRYVVVGVLGEGSQATTLDAVDKKEGRAVAVKRFDVRNARSWKDVELAEREARVLAQLRHPSLPAYGEHFEQDGALYLVMEKVAGAPLAARDGTRLPLGVVDVERMVRELGRTLAYLHGRAPPVIHRDVKPGNVIRRPDGSFALVDFGAVRDKLRPDGGSTVVGTFGYMAPEQFQGRASPKTDVYALGATAVAMLAGRDPDELPHKGLAIDLDSALAGIRIPRELREALGRMLEPDPDRRAASVDEAFRAPSERPRPEPPEPERRPDDPRSRKQKWREDKRRRRDQRRWERASRQHRHVPSFVWPLITVGLRIARLAVVLSTLTLVPRLLHVLSKLFGEHLDEVASSLRREGREALARIADVEARMRAPMGGQTPPPRTRVAEDEVIEAEIVEEEEPARRARRKR